VIDVGRPPLPAATLAVDFLFVGVLLTLTVWITSPSAASWPAWLRLTVLLAQVLATYLPLVAMRNEWGGMAGFLAGSALVLLSGWSAWLVFAVVVASMTVEPLAMALGWYVTIYLGLSTLILGLALFGLTRPAGLTRQVHATAYGELVQLAVMNERTRFARDLHDLLGFSLSVITLKAELIRHLMNSNPARARDELAKVLDIARQALADTRLVANGYLNISLSKEASSVGAVLAAVGIDARVEINCQELDDTVDTVLATVLREALTNMLRHSTARKCWIEACQDSTTVRLRVVNDGVPRSAAHDGHHGGLENLTTRLEAIGGRITVKVRDGWFDLLAEAPCPEVLAAKTSMPY
jgi:two-component system sensor histidine kinase DesK